MKRVLVLCVAVLATVELVAQSAPAVDVTQQRNQKVDEISAPVQDIDARYWAGQVQKGNVTVEELAHFASTIWLGSTSAKQQKLALIEQYVQAGQPVSITPQERMALDENKKQVQDYLESTRFQKASLGDIKAQRDKKIDAITAPVRDLKARELAQQVQDKTITLGALQAASRDWLGSKEENQAVINLAKQYLATGKKITLTPEELDQLDENRRQVRAFLNNGRENPAAAALARKNRQIRQIKEPVFELEARYWAYRIAKVKDVTFDELSQNSHNWVGERSYNQKLMNKVEENLRTGNTKKLTKQEEALLEKTNKQLRQLLK